MTTTEWTEVEATTGTTTNAQGYSWSWSRPRQWLKVADYGLRDEKGRAVGGVARIIERPAGEKLNNGTDAVRPVTKYDVCVQPQRNGQDFGASVPSTSCPTLRAAMDVANKKMNQQERSYEKKFGR